MLGQDPAETYDDDAPLTDRSLGRIESLLKREIAADIIWAQYNRAKGDSPNGYAVRDITDYSRQLRTILRQHDAAEQSTRVWEKQYTDNIIDCVDWDGMLTVREVVESLHETGSEPVVEQ